MPQWMQDLVAGWPIIRANLATFFVILVLITGVAWWLMGLRYSDLLATKDGQIQLQDRQLADYREKLKGATPDQAKSRIDALEAQLSAAAKAPQGSTTDQFAIGSVLVANRYYSAKNKEEIADRLDKISGEINETGNEISQLAELAINHSPWERPGENMQPYIDRLDQISGLRSKMFTALYDQLIDKEREYRVEMNAILFPQEPINNLRVGAQAFRDGLSVWGKMRDVAEGK